MENFINVILWAALIQGFLLALLYIFSKNYKSFANFLLGMFLLSILMEAFNTILPYNSIGDYDLGSYFTLPESKLFIPIFFFHFVLEKLGRSSNYKWFLNINYAIAVLIAGITLANLYLHFFESSSLEKVLSYEVTDSLHLVLQCYAYIIIVVTLSLAIVETLKYRNLVRNEYSDFGMLQINWLWQFIFTLIPATILWGIELVQIIVTGNGFEEFVLVTWGFVALFIYILSYKAFQYPNLFENFPEPILGEKGKPIQNPDRICNRENSDAIQSFMQDKESFLNQNLTIHHFAKEIDMSPRLISSCVNQNLDVNFNEWVNGFRVKKALEIIKNDTHNALTIEGIGDDSGFKSRSTMYAAFQKQLGKSPGYFKPN